MVPSDIMECRPESTLVTKRLSVVLIFDYVL